MTKIKPENPGYLNKEAKLVDSAEVTDADKCTVKLTMIYKW